MLYIFKVLFEYESIVVYSYLNRDHSLKKRMNHLHNMDRIEIHPNTPAPKWN
jgi:hypothetical protein